MAGFPPAPSPSRVLRYAHAVADRSGVSVDLLIGRDRHKQVTRARWALWAMLAQEGFGIAAIGRATGGYDHTTVLHGLRRRAELLPAAIDASVAARRERRLAARPARQNDEWEARKLSLSKQRQRDPIRKGVAGA